MRIVLGFMLLLSLLSLSSFAQPREHLRLISISDTEVKMLLRDVRHEDCVRAFYDEDPEDIEVRKKTIEDDFTTNTYYQFLAESYNNSLNNFNKKMEMIIHITEINDRNDASSLKCSVSK